MCFNPIIPICTSILPCTPLVLWLWISNSPLSIFIFAESRSTKVQDNSNTGWYNTSAPFIVLKTSPSNQLAKEPKRVVALPYPLSICYGRVFHLKLWFRNWFNSPIWTVTQCGSLPKPASEMQSLFQGCRSTWAGVCCICSLLYWQPWVSK